MSENYLAMQRSLIVVVLLQVIGLCSAGDIGNRVVSASCECSNSGVMVNFITEKPFAGRIFARGFPEDPKCSKSFSEQIDTKVTIFVPNGQCNVKTTPTESSVVMMISFHGIFLTTMDRQYKCMCNVGPGGYGVNGGGKGGSKLQTNHLEVSMLPTVELMDTAPLPSCDYTIHADSAYGPQVNHAKVGDKIWHTWKCQDPNVGVFVKNCMATNAEGREVELLDEHGCAVDKTILPDLIYSPDLMQASVETWAFRFSDSSLLNFMCMIETCKKHSGECAGLTPPVCGRGKRSIQTIKGENVMIDNEDSNYYHIGNTLSVFSAEDDWLNSTMSAYSTDTAQKTKNVGNVCIRQEPLITVGVLMLFMLLITAFSTVKILQREK